MAKVSRTQSRRRFLRNSLRLKKNRSNYRKRITRKRRLVLKPQNVYSQSKIMNEDGTVTNLNLLFEGKAFFRKFFLNTDDNSGMIESVIVKYLKNFPHPNIVKIYRVESNFYDQEIVLPNDDNYVNENLIQTMSKVKDFLQSIGVIYIDWKPDNTGIGDDGEFKLFDFNASGLWNLQSQTWIVKPPPYAFWRMATQAGNKNPIEIDNYCFKLGFSKDFAALAPALFSPLANV